MNGGSQRTHHDRKVHLILDTVSFVLQERARSDHVTIAKGRQNRTCPSTYDGILLLLAVGRSLNVFVANLKRIHLVLEFLSHGFIVFEHRSGFTDAMKN